MLKEFFQRRAIRKGASPVPTGLLPLSSVHTAVVLTDSPATCGNALRAFFRKSGINGTVVDVTGIYANLNWYGRPEDTSPLEADLLISLLPVHLYAIEYVASCARARFKVGRTDSKVFDLVFRDKQEKPLPQPEAFEEIVKLLEKIV